MTKRIVLYHGSCPDGFTAAWAVWLRYGDTDTEYVPAWYGGHPPPDVTGCDVVMVDFSYDRATLEQMHRDANSLLVLDHHQTAQAALAGLDYCQFDMNRSGAGMAWDHFHPDTPRPWLVNYVEDRDLWRWALPDSEAMCYGIDSYEPNFELYRDWAGNHAEHCKATVLAKGQALLAYVQRHVKQAVTRARTIRLAGYSVPAVNSSMLQSEIGHALIERSTDNPPPFSVVWFERRDGTRKYSLRSRDDLVDVAAIAAQYGGGGHRNASGFISDGEPPG